MRADRTVIAFDDIYRASLPFISSRSLRLEGVKARNMANRSARPLSGSCHYASTHILLLGRGSDVSSPISGNSALFSEMRQTLPASLVCLLSIDVWPNTCTHDRLARQACAVHVPVCVTLSTTIGDFILALSCLPSACTL